MKKIPLISLELILAMTILTGCAQVKPDCSGGCPFYAPPAANWCDGGTVVDRGKDECGCQLPPKCEYDLTSEGLEKHYCAKSSEPHQAVTPVCGWYNQSIKCFRYPCAMTVTSPDEACSMENVEYWTAGECPNTPPK